MSTYYQFYATGLQNFVVRFSEPFLHATGLGNITTASRACYQDVNGTPVLVAVAALSIPLGDNITAEDEAALLAQTANCPSLSY